MIVLSYVFIHKLNKNVIGFLSDEKRVCFDSDTHVCSDKHIWCGPRQINETGLLHTELIWKKTRILVDKCCVQCLWCESSQCRLSHPWGKTGTCINSHILWSHYSTHTKAPSQSYPPITESTQWSDFSYLALRYGMWVLFQRQRQEVLPPSLETWNKKHNSIKKYSVQHSPSNLQYPIPVYNQAAVHSDRPSAKGGHQGTVQPWAFFSIFWQLTD